MSNKKRFRSAIALILTLLLATALAPAVSAQQDPPNPGGPGDTPTAAPTTPVPPTDPGATPTATATATATATTDPGLPPTPTTTGTPTATATPDPPGNGNGMNGDMGMGTPSSHTWPPPNALVMHAATPVQISAHGGALNVYFVAPGSDVVSGPALASFSALAELHAMGDAVSLYSGTHPGTGKSVTIDYLPDAKKIRVSTYYADRPPHDYNKAYVFTVDADHSVNHERW